MLTDETTAFPSVTQQVFAKLADPAHRERMVNDIMNPPKPILLDLDENPAFTAEL